VLYVDGEMHIGDIQERARLLMDAVPDISRTKAKSNLQFLARQQQDPTIDFPEISDAKPGGGQERILEKVLDGRFDLLILDNFSTLGRVADENAASSFDDIQSFLLKLKTEKVATILVHHTGKSGGGDAYRGSTKLAATFEIMLHLKRYAGDRITALIGTLSATGKHNLSSNGTSFGAGALLGRSLPSSPQRSDKGGRLPSGSTAPVWICLTYSRRTCRRGCTRPRRRSPPPLG
jgi:AAA domain